MGNAVFKIGLLSIALTTAGCSLTERTEVPTSGYSQSVYTELSAMMDGKPRQRKDLIAKGVTAAQLDALVKQKVLVRVGRRTFYLRQAPKRHVRHHLESSSLISAGDAADVVTTAIGLTRDGIQESNPALSWAGDKGTAPVALLLKAGFRSYAFSTRADPVAVNLASNTVGFFAACNNVAIIAGAASGVGLGLGLVCGVLVNDWLKADYEKATGENRFKTILFKGVE